MQRRIGDIYYSIKIIRNLLAESESWDKINFHAPSGPHGASAGGCAEKLGK